MSLSPSGYLLIPLKVCLESFWKTAINNWDNPMQLNPTRGELNVSCQTSTTASPSFSGTTLGTIIVR